MSEMATMPLPATNRQPDAISKAASSYNLAIGYLRAFVTVLVLAHHAVLAYHPFAPPAAAWLLTQPRWWLAFPVVDSQRWSGFALFVGFNDVFFMSLMFFLSGLFVWKSLARKGSAGFLRDRVLRLGLPFVVASALIAPLAYYPTYLLAGSSTGLAGFWREWRSLGNWPAGPAWFVWVLLVFDGIAAAVRVAAPDWGEALGRALAGVARRPAVLFALLVASSALAYVPLALVYARESAHEHGKDSQTRENRALQNQLDDRYGHAEQQVERHTPHPVAPFDGKLAAKPENPRHQKGPQVNPHEP